MKSRRATWMREVVVRARVELDDAAPHHASLNRWYREGLDTMTAANRLAALARNAQQVMT